MDIKLTAPTAAALKSMQALASAAEQRKTEYEQALASHSAALAEHRANLDGFVRQIVEAAGEMYDGQTWALSADGITLTTEAKNGV